MLALTLPRKTKAHAIPAGWKLAGLAIVSALVFPIANIFLLSGLLVGVAILHLLLGRDVLRYAIWMMRPIAVFAAVILLFHIFTSDFIAGLSIILRMLTLVALANLVTMTTKLSEMITIVEYCLTPLAKLGVNTRVFGVATAMVIRFTPVLINKASALRESWRARSAKRAGWRIVMPLFLTAVDDADRVAEALKARGGV
ncbi:energy-coupling factor transporter transmembrane protein EcfT [Amylibacter sp. SFDW26]|uniref:energy-coupling factor transporter transmembrane component T family protein n=1 Tax=Amylibacter sp. SFDW26 TaxID=2652722 RepID=UPI00126208F5|nr:energy-coupling factor transporter transmembrane component T [Amylibacter sp. SFDW26]KAB7616320.1 energy-coupling factor transporter transmembrane protein EcfT [Amylibacter sp. SFDW26]